MTPTFDLEFDPRTANIVAHRAAKTYRVMEWLTGRRPNWPRNIEAMSDAEISDGERGGRGHGLYITPDGIIKINSYMGAEAVYLNFIHENFHHILPEASDEEINEVLVPAVYEKVTGRALSAVLGEEAGV